jgi:hypothetical protein
MRRLLRATAKLCSVSQDALAKLDAIGLLTRRADGSLEVQPLAEAAETASKGMYAPNPLKTEHPGQPTVAEAMADGSILQHLTSFGLDLAKLGINAAARANAKKPKKPKKVVPRKKAV